MRQNPEQLEIKLESGAPSVLPPIVSLRELVEQMERQHGDSLHLEAIRAALDESQPA